MNINLSEELKKCVRCGKCRYHCPVFIELKGEPASPRGRLALVKLLQEGKIDPSAELADKIYTCLLCKTCAVNCPSGVITDEIMVAAREYLTQFFDRGILKKAILKGFLKRPAMLKSAFSLMQLYQKTGLHNVLKKSKLIEFLPEKISAATKIMPDVSSKPARERMPTVVSAEGSKKLRVAYFIGCATNLIYPDVALAGIEVLSKNGCEVVIPEEIYCCGMPHLAYGESNTAVELAKKNIKALLKADVDAVVSDCATCTSTLSEEVYGKLFPSDSEEYEEVKKLAKKVYDINKFLVHMVEFVPGTNPVNGVVTYHDPCHLKRAQNVYDEPREIIKSIPGVDFKEMREADRCCGSAGSFTIMHHDLSMKILDKKIYNVIDTGADLVLTACPTCNMQLSYGLKRNSGEQKKILHPVQLLARSYWKD